MPQALPRCLQSFSSSPDEAVAGPSKASPLDDFKEYHALFCQVATNLGLKAEEMAELVNTLFSLLSVHKEVLNIAPSPSGPLPRGRKRSILSLLRDLNTYTPTCPHGH